MGIFGSKKSNETTAPASNEARPTNAKVLDSIEEATRRLKSIEASRDKLGSLEAEACIAVTQAEEKHAASVEAFEVSVDKFDTDENEQNLKAVRDAQAARDLAAAQLERRTKALEDARENIRRVDDALGKAQEDLTKVERAKRVAELEQKRSVANFQTKARPITERFLKARAEMHEELDALIAEYESANAAADELIKLGEFARRLDPVQLVGQYAVIASEKDPSLADAYVRALQRGESLPSASNFSSLTLRDSLADLLTGYPRSRLDLAAHSNRCSAEDLAQREQDGETPNDLAELHDLLLDTRVAYMERNKARCEEREQKRRAGVAWGGRA